MTKEEHQEQFVKAFIRKEKRERYISFLLSSKRRLEIIERLVHCDDFDDRFTERIPDGEQSDKQILQRLRSLGAPEKCFVISENSEIDGQFMLLSSALDSIIGFGQGSVLSCIPGCLGYYESEEASERYVLHR